MDKPRGELPQIDQNSPEFKKALEIARQEVLGVKAKDKGLKPTETMAESPNLDVGNFGSKNFEVQKTVALDSTVVSEELRTQILNRALEILQSSEKIENPKEFLDALMGVETKSE